MNMHRSLKIATRQSELALWQANHVAGELRSRYPGIDVELLPLLTQGDRILNQPLAAIGGKGLFLKELERALLTEEADLAVHSMKDVPVIPTPDLLVDVMLERANPFDALISRNGEALADLAAGSRVGTSSLRRQCQLRALRPDLQLKDLRGNVNTRIRKLQEGEYEAIILARAGLDRLGLGHLVSDTLQPPEWLPAVTQGTICLQYRAGDTELQQLLQPLNHASTALCAQAERAVSHRLEGSCQMPLAVYAHLEEEKYLTIDALVGTADGKQVIRGSRRGARGHGIQLARELAEDLLNQGADRIIAGLGMA